MKEYKKVDENSVDLVLIDPPYGSMNGCTTLDGWENNPCKWDEKLDFEALFDMCEYLLRKNGRVITFAQEPYTTELIKKSENRDLEFKYKAIWKKSHFGNVLFANEALVKKHEDILIFTKIDDYYDYENENPLREYFGYIMNDLNISIKSINEELGHRKAEHSFYITSTQFSLCTEETYKELIDEFDIDEFDYFKPYEELDKINEEFMEQHKKKYPKVFNLDEGEKYKSDVFEYKKPKERNHPTQKPVPLLCELIRTYSKNMDLVCDFVMGSGSTALACIDEEREFVGFERDEEYYEIAEERIEAYLD